jgi:hypothetical protein
MFFFLAFVGFLTLVGLITLGSRFATGAGVLRRNLGAGAGNEPGQGCANQQCSH